MSGTIQPILEFFARKEILVLLVFALWVAGLLIVKRIFFTTMARVARKTAARFNDLLIESLNFPLTILILGTGAGLVRGLLAAGAREDQFLKLILTGSIALAAVLFGFRLINGLLKHYKDSEKFQILNEGIVRGLAKGALVLLGSLIFLQALGIPITPILASLGIGSLAVALALQDTLSNLFAGIYIMMDKPLQVGEFIKLESGEEGYVIEIGWRSTRIKMLPNNIVVVPNNKLASTVLTNYHAQDKALAVLVNVGVDYKSDLAHVEKATCEVAKKIMETVPGAVPDFEPFIRFNAFADSSINFTVILRAKEFTDQYLLKHEFIKALQKRYAAEGITIPFPVRTLDLPKEIAGRLS